MTSLTWHFVKPKHDQYSLPAASEKQKSNLHGRTARSPATDFSVLRYLFDNKRLDLNNFVAHI
jgi:hypothetical protein